jgi:hypothetical protein
MSETAMPAGPYLHAAAAMTADAATSDAAQRAEYGKVYSQWAGGHPAAMRSVPSSADGLVSRSQTSDPAHTISPQQRRDILEAVLKGVAQVDNQGGSKKGIDKISLDEVLHSMSKPEVPPRLWPALAHVALKIHQDDGKPISVKDAFDLVAPRSPVSAPSKPAVAASAGALRSGWAVAA